LPLKLSKSRLGEGGVMTGRGALLWIVLATSLQAYVLPALADATLRIRLGDSSYGKVVLTVMGSKVHLGDSGYTSTIFTLDGNKVREGDSSYGHVLVTLGSGGRVHRGDSAYGPVIATVTGSSVSEGNSSYGRVIATVDGGEMSGAAAAAFLLLR
jgi:hypothetical protein